MNQIDELRRIIAGESSAQLEELRQRVESLDLRTRDVAAVLAPAIDQELDGESDGQQLITALQRPVSIGLKQAIRTEPDAYAEILYPVMAPSIRRAIAQAISSMMVTINRTIESATTANGLRMRLESMKTGVPYAELALRHALLYRVEHAYLIQRETGMLIGQVSLPDAQSLDSDAVSAMLSAIQSFVQDSFSADEGARLTDFKVGEHTVWVAHGQRVMLACVIFGTAPESLKSELYDTLDGIQSDYANEIADCRGDASAFYGLEERLMPLLQLQLKVEQLSGAKKSSKTTMAGVAAFAVLAYFAVTWFIDRTKLSTIEHFLKQTPGVVVTKLYRHADQVVIEGLKDPSAVIPFSELRAYGIESSDLALNMAPFHSLEPAIERQRLQDELSLPAGVQLSVRDGQLMLVGSAPLLWIETNAQRLYELVRDKRVSVVELSLRPETVRARIERELKRDVSDVLSISVLPGSRSGYQGLAISGELPENDQRRLRSMFAGNRWVTINVRTAGL